MVLQFHSTPRTPTTSSISRGWLKATNRNQQMTPELQKYYEERFSMMATQGWGDLIEDIDNMINALNNIHAISDEKDLQFKKGELSILMWLKTLRQVSEKAYEDLQNEKDV
jgi:hypothetical protein